MSKLKDRVIELMEEFNCTYEEAVEMLKQKPYKKEDDMKKQDDNQTDVDSINEELDELYSQIEVPYSTETDDDMAEYYDPELPDTVSSNLASTEYPVKPKEDVMDNETTRLAKALAVPELKRFLKNEKDKGNKVSKDFRRKKFEELVEYQMKKFSQELSVFKKNVNKAEDKSHNRPVHFFGNVVFLSQFGSKESDLQFMKAWKFAQRLENRTIYPSGEQCRVEGFINVLDYELEDFNDGDITVDVGLGFYEVVTKEDFLNKKLWGLGISEKMQFLSKNEIRYGRSGDFSEGYSEQDVDDILDRMDETVDLDEATSYKYRTKDEMRYHARELRDALSKDFDTWAELYKTCQGTIFPTVYVSKNGKRYPQTWMLPLNAMSKEDRISLRRLYRRKRRELRKMQRKAKIVIAHISKLDIKDRALDEKIEKIFTRTGEDKKRLALSVVAVAKKMMNEKGEATLDNRTWAIVNRPIKGQTITDYEAKWARGLLDELVKKHADPNCNLIFAVKEITPEQASNVLREARFAKADKGESLLPISLWQLLMSKSKERKTVKVELPENTRLEINKMLSKLKDVLPGDDREKALQAKLNKDEAKNVISFAHQIQKERKVQILSRNDYRILCNIAKGR